MDIEKEAMNMDTKNGKHEKTDAKIQIPKKPASIDDMNENRKALGYSYQRISELSGVPLSTVQKVLGKQTEHPRGSGLIHTKEYAYASTNSLRSLKSISNAPS